MSNKGAEAVSDGHDQSSGLARTLRFPEFLGQPFREVRLGAVTEEATIRNGEKLLPSSVMGVRKEDGIVPMEERLVAGNISRYKVVRNNWFAYNPMRLNIGSIARWEGSNEVLVSPDYVVFRCLTQGSPASLLPEYLDHFRTSQSWDAFTNESGDGGVRVRIYYRDLARMRLLLPDVSEQHKIVECLSSIDVLIAAETEKLEALKAHKKGLMQQLFPSSGETTPHLRFPEFQGTDEWSIRPLETVCTILNTRRKPIASSLRVPGPYPYYGASGIVDYVNDYLFDEPVVLVGEDGAKWGAFERTAFIVEGPSWVNNHAHVLRPEYAIGTFLMNYLVRFDFHPFVTGKAPPKLTLSKLKVIPIPVPPTRAEQLKIGSALSSMDALIDAQVRRVGELKAHKNGLMQKLFPLIDEVSV